MRSARRRHVIALFAIGTLVLAGCSVDRTPSPTAQPTPTPASTLEPRPDRPVVKLAYRVADDRASVSGQEQVVFTPDRRICEVVLRSWVNKPMTFQAGNSMEVTSLEVDGQKLPLQVGAAGAPAGAPGTLVEAALPQCRDAGTALTIRTTFQVTLGRGTDERVGYSRAMAWFASAFPMLAWQFGVGWVRDEAVAVNGEMSTSEMFRLDDLAVTASAEDAVSAAGEAGLVTTENDGTRTHHFSAPAMRDVSVVVGDLTVDEHAASGVRVHVAVPQNGNDDPDAWRRAVDDSLQRLVDYLGPCPFPDVWVAVVPAQSDGIESTGAVQLGGISPRRDQWLITHELAHLWTYGLVGNNQAQHPWLDESVTSMIQAVVDDDRGSASPDPASAARMGWSMAQFATLDRGSSAYEDAVYVAGQSVLLRARDAAGHESFDAALRAYLAANGNRIAGPDDFRTAFADVPGVVSTLTALGVLR